MKSIVANFLMFLDIQPIRNISTLFFLLVYNVNNSLHKQLK